MGKIDYTLIKSDRKTVSLQIRDGEIIVRAPKKMKKKDIDRFVCEHADWIAQHLELDRARRAKTEAIEPLSDEEAAALKKAAQEYIPGRVEHFARLLGVDYKKISYRFQTSRWGSCTSDGNLSFNCLLMLAPYEVVDAIIVHELAHRREMNHSKKFYAEVLRVYPDYHTHHAYLKQNGSAIMKRNPRSK